MRCLRKWTRTLQSYLGLASLSAIDFVDFRISDPITGFLTSNLLKHHLLLMMLGCNWNTIWIGSVVASSVCLKC